MSTHALLSHFDRISDAPTAIPRFRQFILDLAVRGKLVDQDPNDEPASTLLKRIASEKQRLAEEGKIRYRQSPRLARADEVTFRLKPGWRAASISEILIDLQTGPFGSSLHQSDYEKGGIPVINPASIKNGRLVPIDAMRVGTVTLERLAAFKLRERDIVMGRRGEMGRCAVVTEKETGWLCGTGSLILRLPECVSPPFFVTLIGSPLVREYLGGSAVGATMQNLNQSILMGLVVGLPPFAEQHRIVTKVKELMALCDQFEEARNEREAGRDRLASSCLHHLGNANADTLREHASFYLSHLPSLTTRHEQIKQLRQTVLDLAVGGRLVRQDHRDDSASELLARLQRALLVERQNESSRIRKPLASSKRDVLNGIAFPFSWAIADFDSVSAIVSGVAKGKDLRSLKTALVPYLRVANVQRGYLDLSVIKEIEVPVDEVQRYQLRRGDVLMTEGGDWDKLGRAAIWSEEIPGCIHQNHIYRIRSAIKDELLPSWIALFANSSLGRSYFEAASKQTTNLASINMTQLRSCPLPIPPTSEQRRVVARVDELMALCDGLAAQLHDTQLKSRQLLEAVLDQALNGSGAKIDEHADHGQAIKA